MNRWLDLLKTKGVYISPVYDLTSDVEFFNSKFTLDYQKNNGDVKVFVRISFDGSHWGEWIQINDVAHDVLFLDDYYHLEYCKFQYKVELLGTEINPPIFKSFKMHLDGGFVINNIGDLICKPEIWIKKVGSSGTVKLTNENNGQTMILQNLNRDEEVYVDCENEDIVSSLNVYRYNDHNNVFIELELGENVLTGEGEFELAIRYEFKTLQG